MTISSLKYCFKVVGIVGLLFVIFSGLVLLGYADQVNMRRVQERCTVQQETGIKVMAQQYALSGYQDGVTLLTAMAVIANTTSDNKLVDVTVQLLTKDSVVIVSYIEKERNLPANRTDLVLMRAALPQAVYQSISCMQVTVTYSKRKA